MGIKPPDAGTGGLHGHRKPVPVRLSPNGTDHGSERPKKYQIKVKTHFRGVYLILADNNLMHRIEGVDYPYLAFYSKSLSRPRG